MEILYSKWRVKTQEKNHYKRQSNSRIYVYKVYF
jgi:hypothetical protein